MTNIGIDLGTTYTAVAVVRPGEQEPRLLPNRHGKLLTPSVVWYQSNGKIVVGDEAKEQLRLGNPDVMSFGKREMGNRLYQYPAGGRFISPLEFSRDILKEIKADAERALGHSVKRAVITVPAYFAAPQRDDTLKAAEEAGLEVRRIINEPAAAGLAFVRLRPADGVYLVYDLGGGTFDVAVLRVESGPPVRVKMLAYAGDSYLGGRNFDERLTIAVREEVRVRHRAELLNSAGAQNQWIVQSENYKRMLTEAPEVRATYQVGGGNGEVVVTRAAFEQSCRGLVDQTLVACNKALRKAFSLPASVPDTDPSLQKVWASLAGVLLVGGSTRMPMITNRLRAISGQEPRRDVHPDEAVACGAAWCAIGEQNPTFASLYDEIVAHQMGAVMVSKDGKRWVNSCVLPEGTPVEQAETQQFAAVALPDREGYLELYVTQGASRDPNSRGCRILGRYRAQGIPQGNGLVKVNVTFRYTANATVDIQAQVVDGPTLRITAESLTDLFQFREPPKPIRVALPPLQIALVIDHSISMEGKKFEQARAAAGEFLGTLKPGSQVAIIGYGTESWEICPLTADPEQVRRCLAQTNAINSGTNFQPALARGRQVLAGQSGRRVLLLITDGQNQDRDAALTEAQVCRAAGIVIHTIGTYDADRKYLEMIGEARVTRDSELREAIVGFGQEIAGDEVVVGNQVGDDESASRTIAPEPTPEPPDLFSALGVPPDTPVFQLSVLLREAQSRWSLESTQAGEQAVRARVLLEYIPYYEQMVGANRVALEADRQRATEQLILGDARQRLQIDQALNAAASDEGFLVPDDLSRIAAETGVGETEVRAAAANLNLRVEAARKINFPTLEPVVWSDTAGKLDSLGYPDLYAMLAATGETRREELLRRIVEQRNRVEAEEGDTSNGRTRLSLLANAAEFFGSPEQQRQYDNSRTLAKLEDFRPTLVAAAGPSRRLTVDRQKELLQQMVETRGTHAVAAEAFLLLVANDPNHPILLERRRKDEPFKAQLRCPECQRGNPTGAGKCEGCGFKLKIGCPRCKQPNEWWERECTNGVCKFNLTQRPDADDAVAAAKRKLRNGDHAEARRLIEEALRLWPGHEDALVVLQQIEQDQVAKEQVVQKVSEAQAQNRHREALRLIGQAQADPRLAPLQGASQIAVQKAAAEVTQGDEYTVAKQFDYAYDCYDRAAQLCSDGDGPDRCRVCPPMPVPAVRCTVQADRAILDWDPSSSKFGSLEYLVRMSVGVPPQGPEDGVRLTCGPTLRLATPIEPGQETHFAVFALRDGVVNPSPTLHTGSVICAPAVTDFRAVPGAGSVTLRFTKPTKADRVEVFRKAPEKNIPVPAGAGSAVDVGLRDGTPQTYAAVAVYVRSGREFRSSAETATCTPAAPGKTIMDLNLTLEPLTRSKLIAQYTPPESGQVLLFANGSPHDLPVGYLLEHENLHQLGDPISADEFGEAQVPIMPGELVVVTPATLHGKTIVVGLTRSYCRVEPVEQLIFRPGAEVGKYKAEFVWPAGATAATLVMRDDTCPLGPDDPHATRIRVTRHLNRAVVDVEVGNAPTYYAAVYAEVRGKGEVYRADDAAVCEFPVGSRRIVYYRVTPVFEKGRRFLGRLRGPESGDIIAVRIEIVPDRPCCLPSLGLFYQRDGRPRQVDEKRLISSIPSSGSPEEYGPQQPLDCIIDLDESLPRGGFRVFPLSGTNAVGWRFIDIPGRQTR